jgi:ABC-2 type transport system permease protein
VPVSCDDPRVGDPRTEDARPAPFGDLVRSEWTKLRTLRFTAWALFIAPLYAVGYAIFLGYLTVEGVNPGPARDPLGFDPTAISFGGLASSQLVLAALGAIVITSEYSSGTVRLTLAATPRRGRLLLAKALLLAVVLVPLGEFTALVAFGCGQAVLAAGGIRYAVLDQPHVLRAVLGAGLYLAVVGLVSLAVGVLVRHTVAALVVMVLSALVAPSLLGLLPGATARAIAAWWPFTAGSQIMVVPHGGGPVGPWTGLVVLSGCAVALLLVAARVLHVRDT